MKNASTISTPKHPNSGPGAKGIYGCLRASLLIVLAGWLSLFDASATDLSGWPKQEWLEWSRTAHLQAMTLDAGGNAILAGSTAGQIRVVKINGATGAVLWDLEHEPNPAKNDNVVEVSADGAGNIIVTGTSASFSVDPDAGFTLKLLSASGSVMWSKTEDLAPTTLVLDAGGNVILAGIKGWEDGKIVKRAGADGELVWEKEVLNVIPGPSSSNRVTLNDVAVAGNGDVIITGRANRHSHLTYYRAGLYVARYAASDGAVLWEKREDTTLDGTVVTDEGRSVLVDGAGNVIVGGRSISAASQFYGEFFFAKYSGNDGSRHWYRSHVPAGAFLGDLKVLALGADGNVVAGGLASMVVPSVRYQVTKVRSSDGVVLWDELPVASNYGTPLAVQVHSSGDVVLSGFSSQLWEGGAYTAALSGATGAMRWEHHFPWPDNSSSVASGMNALLRLDGSGNPVMAWTGWNQLDSTERVFAQKLVVMRSGGPQLTVKLGGNGLTSGVSTVDFGSVETGTSNTITLTLENTGNADLTFRDLVTSNTLLYRAVDITGTNAAEIEVGVMSQLWLKPGETTSLQLTSTPQAPGGRSATFSLVTLNAGTFTCALATTGIEPEVTLTQGPTNITNGTAFLAGDVLRDNPLQRTFTITNDGTAPLTGLAVSSTLQPGYGDLTIGALGSTTLAPTESTTFTVSFTPSQAGLLSVPLRLVSNDRDEGTFNFYYRVNSLFRSLKVYDTTTELTSGASTVDMGYVYPSGSNVITLWNYFGTSDLTLASVTLSGNNASDFSVTGPVSNVIGPGLNTTFTLNCTPSGVGPRTATVTIVSDSMPANTFVFNVVANQVTAELEVSRYQGAVLTNGGAVQSFGTVALGAGVKRDFVISSVGSATLNNIAVSVLGTDAGDVTVTQPGKTSMGVGETTGFSATFTPGALGLRTATLRIVSNDMSDNPFDIPISITGASPGMALLQEPGGSSLEAGATVSFGDILIGEENMLTFSVRNTGGVDLENIVISVEGANFSEVEVTRNDFFMVEPGHESSFDVTWRPQAAGTRAATLRVVSSDVSRSPYLVNLTATGKTPQPRIDVQYPFGNSMSSGDTIDFGTHLVDEEQVENVTIFNIGPADLTNIAVSKSGPGTGDFTFGLEQDEGGADKRVLSKDENQYLWVAFRPGTSGVSSATLTITSNDTARSPFLIQLTGVGQPRAPQLVVAEQPAGPNLPSGATITYPNMEINGIDGPWTEKAFRIQNLGEGTLTGISVAKGGTAVDEVTFGTYAGTIPTSLAPGAQFTLWVKFWVKTEGPRQAFVSIASNDPTSSLFTLNLASNGMPAPVPAIEVTALPEDEEVDNGDTYDFGNIVMGSTGLETKKYFEVSNEGTALLTNIKFWIIGETAADVTIGSDDGPIPPLLAIEPGESEEIWVKLKTTTAGTREATIKVTSNDPEESPFLVHVRGNIVGQSAPQLRIEEMPGSTAIASGSSINFGEMIPNDGIGVEKTYRLVNSGTGLMTGLNASIAGTNNLDVSITPISDPLPAELAAGASWQFKLKYVAGGEGPRTCQFKVTSSSEGVGPFEVSLTAVGLPSTPVLRVLELPNQILKAHRSTLQFDAMVAGEDGGAWAQRSIRLHNASAATFTGLDINVTGTHAAEVTYGPESSPIPLDIGPNQFVDVWVRFDVAAVGERTATLEVRSSAPGVPLYELFLRSNGAGWDAFAPGLYDGLLHDQAGGELVGSLSTIAVSKATAASGFAGVATGTLRLRGRNASIKGNFLMDGTLNASLNQTDGSTVVLNLQLEQGNGTLAGGAVRVVGTVTWQGVTADAVARKIPYTSISFKAPASQRGAFTFLLPSQGSWPSGSPRGEGWMTGTMSTSGRLALVACLGDGTRFTKTCLLSGDCEWALYQELYRTVPLKGRIGGVMTHRDVPDVSDVDGVFQWIKLNDSREVMHAGGFDLEVQVIGSRFIPPLAAVRSLNQLADQEYNATLTFVGDTLPQPGGWFKRVASWKKDDQVIHYGRETLRATVSRSTGGMTGNYTDPETARTIAFSGVAFQKQGLAAGCFVTNNRDGSVIVLPDATSPYPGSEPAGTLLLPDVPAAIALPPLASDVSPWVSTASGSFLGLLHDSADELAGALESFTLSSTGSFSGALRINTLRYAFSNKLITSTGQVSFNITRRGKTPISVQLRLVREDADSAGYQVQGTVTIDDVTLDLAAQRLPKYRTTDRSPQEGLYTLAMMAPNGVDPYAEPGGHGHATLTVSYLGKCTGTLTLPEGSITTFAGHISRQGQWSFYRNLYGTTPKGSLGGLITFRDEAGLSDLDGEWRWVKLPGALPTSSYPSGFDTTRKVIGSRYIAPLPGQRATSGLDDDFYNAWFRLSGPDYSTSTILALSELDRVITWNSKNKIQYWGPDKLTTMFNATTGGMSGSYTYKNDFASVSFSGVLLQKQNLVVGKYGSQGKSGSFSIQKR